MAVGLLGNPGDDDVVITGLTSPATPHKIQAIAITVKTAGQQATATFDIAPVDVPDAFIETRIVGGQPAEYVKPWTDIRKAIADAWKASESAGAALEVALLALSRLEIRADAAASGFLDVRTTPFGALAAGQAFIALDLMTLASTDADDVVFSATLAAHGTLSANGVNVEGGLRFDLAVTRAGIASLLPSISLPALDLQWPKIPFPKLSLPSFDLGGLTRLLRFDLPMPHVAAPDVPLRLVWNAPPQITLGIANGTLTVTTTAAASGQFFWSGSRIADITNFTVTLTGAGLALTGTVSAIAAPSAILLPAQTISRPDLLPFTVEIAGPTIALKPMAQIDLANLQPSVALTATLALPRVLIRAKSDPSLLLALRAVYEQSFDAASGNTHGKLTELSVVEPYPVALIALAAREAADLADALMRLVAAIPVHVDGPNLTPLLAVLDRIADMIGAAVRWLAKHAGAAAGVLLDVAEAAAELLAALLRQLRAAMSAIKVGAPHLVIEVRLDSRDFALRQIVVAPAWTTAPATAFTAEALGFAVEIPQDWTPALLIDFEGPGGVALLARPSPSVLKIGTDLWLARDGNVDAIRDTTDDGKRPAQAGNATGQDHGRLISVSCKFTGAGSADAIALMRVSGGKAHFMERAGATVAPVSVPIPTGALNVARIKGPMRYAPLKWSDFAVDVDAKSERLLPFLQQPLGGGGGAGAPSFINTLGQYIKVKAGKASVTNGVFELPLTAELNISGTKADITLKLGCNLTDFRFRITGGDRVSIHGKNGQPFNLYGLNGKFESRASKPPGAEIDILQLDFASGDARLALHPDVRLEFAYGKVSSSGRGLVFHVDTFAMSRGGLDLDAAVDKQAPVQLAGIDMPFRFDSGGLSVKSSRIQAFSIAGSGQLPPELIGEANASVAITMGRGADGSLIVQSAEAKLEKPGEPIECHATAFVLTLSALGFEFHNFAPDGGGYHFYFTLTGSAKFDPAKAGGIAAGLLKNLGSITITLDKAPLARDASMLARAISFQVVVEPKKTFNFFNLFQFELRGIGFRPSSPAFGGKPAMSISGQLKFAEAGDVPSARFDFHELWIAPPKKDDWRPQVRMDGLTVGIKFGGGASIEATAIAVDETLPSLYKPGTLPADVTAQGFLASGRLTLTGWGPMAAAMGFLELRKKNSDEIRHAFFIYAQMGDLSIKIPTPIPIYLREVGFGFGYRFTLAAFNRADKVKNVKELIEVLDDISKYQGDLASLKAWEPEAEGNRLTLALRGLISVATASSETSYNATQEKDLPNPVLFDIVAALRSDLTFFMNARVWVCRNYADWRDASSTEPWRSNPTLRGYMYLSVPRKEFLARLVSDGTGDVEGTHPKLPEPIVAAMKAVRWSATTYIKPGLFHQEYGWPYELGFTFARKEGPAEFQISCSGGMINRIEDLSVLYGIAFRARGYAVIKGEVGGRSFGASAEARADFSLDAKMIAYVSLRRFSESMFYGSLAFDVSIALHVRIWLNIDAKFFSIHLSVQFALSLTISVGLEVAVWTDSLAARGSVSVAVGAFGRHVRLAIGLSINGDKLVDARARVERFLQLGLTVATPDAEQGVAQPPAELPRGGRTDAADDAADAALAKHDEVAAAPGIQPQGRDLVQSGYWAMLFPVAEDQGKEADQRRYVMIFVPRDHSETGLEPDELPAKDDQGHTLGTFYPPPRPTGAALNVSGVNVQVDTLTYTPSANTPDIGGVVPVSFASHDVVYKTDRIVATDKDKYTLDQLMTGCFVTRAPGVLAEPLDKAIQSQPERLPGDREAAAQILLDAGRDQILLDDEHRAANDLEERRSAIIAALCDSAAKLAEGGSALWTGPSPATGLDVRALGIAFVVRESGIDELFEKADLGGDVPRPARFDVYAPGIGAQPVKKLVHLFNPPERMFDRRGPRLAEPVIAPTAGGVRLDWDLEPAFGSSHGVWHDPEFSLKHYRIERRLTNLSGSPLAAPMKTTAKAAGPLRLVRDPVTSRHEWRFVRPNAQFVDDLSDLTPAQRLAFLPPPPPGDDTKPAAGLVLRYTIVPVDVGGVAGAPTPLTLQSNAQPRPRLPVLRAALHFAYPADAGMSLPEVIAAVGKKPALALGIDDGIDKAQTGSREGDRKLLDAPRKFTLRVRKEKTQPTGLYGSDAVSDARTRPSPADFAVKYVTDVDFDVVLNPRPRLKAPRFDDPLPCGASTTDVYTLIDIAGFLKEVGVERKPEDRLANGPLGIRLAIRPVVREGAAEPTWCPVDLTMQIDVPASPPNDAMPAVAAPVEIFEHPVAIDSAPLMAGDLDGDAGRLMVQHPRANATIDDLLGGGDAMDLRPDIERRVGTRIRWAAAPGSSDTDAPDRSAARLSDYFGGYDLFEIDAASEAEGAVADIASARPIARVQALPDNLAGLDPAEISDFAKLQARYPSETQRLDTATAAGRKDGTTLGPWYSPAESFVVWPDRLLRRSLSISVDEQVLAELLANGRPRLIRVSLDIVGPAKAADDEWFKNDLIKLIDASTGHEIPPQGAPAPAGSIWTARGLRAFLQVLTWNSDHADIQRAFIAHPAAFAGARFAVAALDGAGNELASAKWDIDLDPLLHPVLADVIDWARYDDQPSGTAVPGARYRRYEPVIEALPKTPAKTISGWLDDTPTQRDRYGWGVMRALGLAAGLKLYDTEMRSYLDANDTIGILNKAFKTILPRYAFASVGAPFIDVIAPSGGTMTVASFDGAAPAVEAGAVDDFLQRALKLVQIALRPTADRMTATSQSRPIASPVAYFVVRRTADDVAVTIDLTRNGYKLDQCIALDVIDLTPQLAKPPMITLSQNEAPPPSGSGEDVLAAYTARLVTRKALRDEATEQFTLTFAAGGKIGDAVALVRAIVSTGAAASVMADGGWVDGAEIAEISQPQAGGEAVEQAFGRFADLTAGRFETLARPGAPQGIPIQLQALFAYARRAFPDGERDQELSTLTARLPEWSRRFLDHGPSRSPKVQVGGIDTWRIGFSLAEVTRPDPWRVGIGEDGMIEVLIPHDDRKRRLKRYAVRPFGRYEPYVEAMRSHAAPDELPQPPRLEGKWSEGLAQPLKGRLFDIVLPRSEPLAPPVLIDAKRIEILGPAHRVDNVYKAEVEDRVLEFLFTRHAEEILSESNITVEGALSFESVSYGFWREFPMQRWARDLKPGIDTAAGFGDWHRGRPAPGLIAGHDKFGGLATIEAPGNQPGRYDDGWRALQAIRTRNLPFFFRSHVAAFASAGVVVSDPIVATIPEGHYELHKPWELQQSIGKPRWSVELEHGRAFITVKLPLVRLLDGMPAASRALWLDGRPAPDVFTLPDPQARYEIALSKHDEAIGMTAVSAEIDVYADPRVAADGARSRYAALVPGPYFESANPATLQAQDPAVAGTIERPWWQLDINVALRPRPPVQADTFLPVIADVDTPPVNPLTQLDMQPADFLDPAWMAVAPRMAVTVTLDRGGVIAGQAAWPALQARIVALRDRYRLYAPDAAAGAIAGFLESWANANAGALPADSVPVAGFAAGLPRATATPLVTIAPSPVAPPAIVAWQWPVLPDGIDIGVRMRRRVHDIAGVAAAAAPIVRALRQSWTARQRNAEEETNAAAYGAVIADPSKAAALALGQAATLPFAVDVIVEATIAIRDDHPPLIVDLIAAIEALPAEIRPHAAGAIADLGAFEDGGLSGTVHLPARLLNDAGVAAALAALAVVPTPPQWAATTWIQWRPPTDAERQDIVALLPPDGELRELIEKALFAQLFGEDRKPRLKVCRGSAAPFTEDIGRA